jgi:hypothetical protein
VVIYLGMKVSTPRGLLTLISFGSKDRKGGRSAARRTAAAREPAALAVPPAHGNHDEGVRVLQAFPLVRRVLAIAVAS